MLSWERGHIAAYQFLDEVRLSPLAWGIHISLRAWPAAISQWSDLCRLQAHCLQACEIKKIRCNLQWFYWVDRPMSESKIFDYKCSGPCIYFLLHYAETIVHLCHVLIARWRHHFLIQLQPTLIHTFVSSTGTWRQQKLLECSCK